MAKGKAHKRYEFGCKVAVSSTTRSNWLVVITRFTAKVSAAVKQLFQRRNAIEPIIGHAKSDHGLARNYLRGTHGDLINALLVGCGFNIAKLLHCFAHAQPAWICA